MGKLNIKGVNGNYINIEPGDGTPKSLTNADFKYIRNTVAEIPTVENPGDGDVLLIKGYHENGDGGHGTFVWDPSADKSEHNGGTVIDPLKAFPSDWDDENLKADWFNGNNSGTGCWRRLYDGAVNVKWFGAKGDGITDDIKSIQKAVKINNVFIPNGNYKISSNIYQYNDIVGQDIRNTIITCGNNGIFMEQQKRVILSNMTIMCSFDKPSNSIGLYSTYLSSHQCVFKNLQIENFETNILTDSWNNEFNNIVSNNAKYGMSILSKTGSASNIVRIYNSSFYTSTYGIYINPDEKSFNIILDGCDIERNDIGLYANNAFLLSINNTYFENNTTNCFSLTNSSIDINSVKYDKFEADECTLSINNFIRFYDESANITNCIISYNTANSMYRMLTRTSCNNSYTQLGKNVLPKLESYANYIGTRYGSALDISFASDQTDTINGRDGYVYKAERKNSDTPDATGLYINVPSNINRKNIFFRIRVKGKGLYQVLNNLSDQSSSQFQHFTPNEYTYSDFVFNLDNSSSDNNVIGIRFSNNTGDYLLIDCIAVGNCNVPTFESNITDIKSGVPTSGYFKLNDKIINNMSITKNQESWICSESGNPGTWINAGILNNSINNLSLTDSTNNTLNMPNATSISIPNIATSVDDVDTGELYSDAGTIKIKS